MTVSNGLNPPQVEPVSLEDARRFGFVRSELLAGNVGYVDIRGFDPSPASAQAAATVMSFLASSDAVIFDLRQNGGGAGSAVDLLFSYLFGAEPVHLNDFYDREGNLTYAAWTPPVEEGPRLTRQAVYVLTSERTFSGAEAFAYTLNSDGGARSRISCARHALDAMRAHLRPALAHPMAASMLHIRDDTLSCSGQCRHAYRPRERHAHRN